MLKQEKEGLASKLKDNSQSKSTAKLLDSDMLDAFLNNGISSFTSQKEGRVTALVAKARRCSAAENQYPQKYEKPVGSYPNNTVIKIELNS